MNTIKFEDVKENTIYNILIKWGNGYKKAVGRYYKEGNLQCEEVYLISDSGGVGFEKPAEVIFLSEIGKVS